MGLLSLLVDPDSVQPQTLLVIFFSFYVLTPDDTFDILQTLVEDGLSDLCFLAQLFFTSHVHLDFAQRLSITCST